MIRRAIALLAGMAVCCAMVTMAGFQVFAEEATTATVSGDLHATTDDVTLAFYSEVVTGYPSTYATCFPIQIPVDSAVTNSGTLVTCENGSILWEETVTALTWAVTVPQDGQYMLRVRYQSIKGVRDDMVRALEIDGKVPFYEAQNIAFYNLWTDAGKPVVNQVGDEVRPKTELVMGYQEVDVTDSLGWHAEPLRFYLTAGEHKISMQFISQPMELAGLSLVPYEPIASYKDVSASYPQGQTGTWQHTFEAEAAATVKSDGTIRMHSNSDPATTPNKMGYRVFNTVGGKAWRVGNQMLTMKFQVKETGLYQLGFRYLQTWNDGLPSYRTITLDGEVPFAEMLDYKFSYGFSWQKEVLSDKQGNPYLFYLEAGEHTIQMRVTMESIEFLLRSMYNSMLMLSDIQLDIHELTGTNVDSNYDYEFFRYIPTLEGDLLALEDTLRQAGNFLLNTSQKTSSMSSNLISSADQIRSMVEDPFTIAARISQLESLLTNLGTWYSDLQEQPLQLDRFTVAQLQAEITYRKANFFERLWAGIAHFGLSFVKDYNNIASADLDASEVQDVLSVWVSRGTEWAEIIKGLADSKFTQESKILVNLNIVPSGQLSAGGTNALMLSIISGDAPDVAMGVDVSSPVEFAIRDTVVDISKFSDYNEVKSRFLNGIMTAYTYRGGVYALPETMTFSALFYRTDVFEKYGFTVPNTRQELYDKLLPDLYRNGMQFYQPNDYAPFLLQHGGSYYTEDGLTLNLDTPEAFDAFEELTQMFTYYNCPVSSNFFNRFRTGEMPIGVGNFSDYVQLSTAAPELTGRWAMAPLLGVEEEDGTINRSTGGVAGDCSIILTKDEARQQSAWEFLKWWTSEQTQREYAGELEALLGMEGRWNTSNVKAFRSLNWNTKELKVIESGWEWAQEMPVVLGGYYTNRYIGNAFNSVVVTGGISIRDALEDACKEIQKEMWIKQKEYGVTADE